MSELRTGTSVTPRPDSSARRIPVVTGGGKPGIAAERATSDGFADPPTEEARCTVFVLFHTGQAASAKTRRTAAAAPIPSTVGSKAKPGFVSALRAVPIGISAEARYAHT